MQARRTVVTQTSPSEFFVRTTNWLIRFSSRKLLLHDVTFIFNAIGRVWQSWYYHGYFEVIILFIESIADFFRRKINAYTSTNRT